MLQLDDCKTKLASFKLHAGLKYELIRIVIFGSVVRKENTDNSDSEIKRIITSNAEEQHFK